MGLKNRRKLDKYLEADEEEDTSDSEESVPQLKLSPVRDEAGHHLNQMKSPNNVKTAHQLLKLKWAAGMKP